MTTNEMLLLCLAASAALGAAGWTMVWLMNHILEIHHSSLGMGSHIVDLINERRERERAEQAVAPTPEPVPAPAAAPRPRIVRSDTPIYDNSAPGSRSPSMFPDARLRIAQALSDELDLDLNPDVLALADRVLSRLYLHDHVVVPCRVAGIAGPRDAALRD